MAQVSVGDRRRRPLALASCCGVSQSLRFTANAWLFRSTVRGGDLHGNDARGRESLPCPCRFQAICDQDRVPGFPALTRRAEWFMT
jgi:hypothetical protein